MATGSLWRTMLYIMTIMADWAIKARKPHTSVMLYLNDNWQCSQYYYMADMQDMEPLQLADVCKNVESEKQTL